MHSSLKQHIEFITQISLRIADFATSLFNSFLAVTGFLIKYDFAVTICNRRSDDDTNKIQIKTLNRKSGTYLIDGMGTLGPHRIRRKTISVIRFNFIIPRMTKIIRLLIWSQLIISAHHARSGSYMPRASGIPIHLNIP